MEQIPDNNPMFDYLDTYYDILDEMKQEMTSVRQTASISRDFITQMIPITEQRWKCVRTPCATPSANR